jgi:NTP pyrophosphatase (non-canonical NTP hydrolase)
MDSIEITQKQNDIMDISQEECAEVIQAISKIRRFGLNSEHNGVTNKEHLEEEVGDLMCMFNLLDEFGLVDWTRVSMHAQNKRKKLQTWSTIFKE